jgi:hypothetical protein
VADCGACAVDWDINCLAFVPSPDCETFGWVSDEGNPILIPRRFTGECYEDIVFGEMLQIDPDGQGYECDDSCTCEASTDYSEYLLPCGDATFSGSEGEFMITYGISDPSDDTPSPCESAEPCGPDSCVPGEDDMCVVFTVFANEDDCEIVDFQSYSTVGDYHAFAIADNTCRMDGSGRSWYRLAYLADTDSGVGLIGCADDECSTGCSLVDMVRATCSTPNWANGLTLVALGDPSEFPDEYDESTPLAGLDDAVYIVAAELTFANLAAADVVESDLVAAIADTTDEAFDIVSYEDASLLVTVNFFFETESTAIAFHEDAATALSDVTYNGESATVEVGTVEVSFDPPTPSSDDDPDFDDASRSLLVVSTLVLFAFILF